MAVSGWTHFLSLVLLFSLSFRLTACWDSGDFALFDLVDEISGDFYSFMGVQKDATPREIRKAYRQKALEHHPDKSQETSGEKFMQITSVYEILKNEENRGKYDSILENGLPDWRTSVYYFRKVHKMGLLEMFCLVLAIVTVIHYAAIWAAYWEKSYSIEQVLESKRKPDRRNKLGNSEEIDAQIEALVAMLPRPSLADLVPIKATRAIFYHTINLPSHTRAGVESLKELLKKKEEPVDEGELSEIERLEAEARRKKKAAELAGNTIAPTGPAEVVDIAPKAFGRATKSTDDDVQSSNFDVVTIRKGEWTEDELTLLVRALNKFPGGTVQRWGKVSSLLPSRSPAEVAAKAKEMKEKKIASDTTKSSPMNGAAATVQKTRSSKRSVDVVTTDITVNEEYADGDREEVRTSSESPDKGAAEWSQVEQKLLEWALSNVSKTEEDRWGKIAGHIPGKTKTDCLHRYKHLATAVRQRKVTSAAVSRPHSKPTATR